MTRTQLGKERVRQFSNPWRPASLHDQSESRIGSGDNSLLHVLLQLRSVSPSGTPGFRNR